MKIYVCYHAPAPILQNEALQPIIVGNALLSSELKNDFRKLSPAMLQDDFIDSTKREREREREQVL